MLESGQRTTGSRSHCFDMTRLIIILIIIIITIFIIIIIIIIISRYNII